MQVTTFLWFDGHAEAAASHYTALFADSRLIQVQRGPDDNVMTVAFELAGQRFMAFNGGARFAFTEAVSLYVDCDSQSDIDTLWDGLVDGGQAGPGGWLTDRFGVSWQIIPTVVGDLLNGADAAAAERVMAALHNTTKIDINSLIEARGR